MAMAAKATSASSSPLLSPDVAAVALVTGCSDGGMGHAFAMELAARGFHVIASSRSASTIAKALQELPNVEALDLDVSSSISISHAVSSILQKHGRIDILINNAGVPCNAPTAEIPLSLLESTFRTNVFGPIALIEAVAPYMIQARQGKIVNVGSIGGFIAGPWAGAYAASKSALHALTDSLRHIWFGEQFVFCYLNEGFTQDLSLGGQWHGYYSLQERIFFEGEDADLAFMLTFTGYAPGFMDMLFAISLEIHCSPPLLASLRSVIGRPAAHMF